MEFDRDINDLAGFLTIERGLSGNSVAAYTSDLKDAAEFFAAADTIAFCLLFQWSVTAMKSKPASRAYITWSCGGVRPSETRLCWWTSPLNGRRRKASGASE